MFERITPEEVGLPSKIITEFINCLENCGAATHGVLFLRDGKIFSEGYWKPFHKDFNHRMYSQTKSFVGIAIGLLEEEGKLSLDDKIIDYFPEKIDIGVSENLKKQTIKDMLTMRTRGGCARWFDSNDTDRTHLYLNEDRRGRIPGALWAYDSAGSQVLSSLVEKLAQMPLLEYLKLKLFDHIGSFKTAKILKTKNGDSWGDSAMVCTLRDMATFGQFVMNYGEWNGKRLMNERYLREATSKITDNKEDANYTGYSCGYGYQIWRVVGNGFAFIGMGDQLTVCYPDKKLIFCCVSDNQGAPFCRKFIFWLLENLILKNLQDCPLPKNTSDYSELENKLSNLELKAVSGFEDSEFRKELDGRKYVCEKNPMGITEFSFKFNGKEQGEFKYVNAQGAKSIAFGVNKNVFGKFPQTGYSRENGGVATTDGFTYNDAVSFAWLEDKKIMLLVQIIDDYFGNMCAIFAFKDDWATVSFTKTAEAFLEEYQGVLIARKESE